MSAEKHIRAAANAVHQVLVHRAALIDHLLAARDAGASFEGISRGIAVELASAGLSMADIEKTGTGAGNIRKLLKGAGCTTSSSAASVTSGSSAT